MQQIKQFTMSNTFSTIDSTTSLESDRSDSLSRANTISFNFQLGYKKGNEIKNQDPNTLTKTRRLNSESLNYTSSTIMETGCQ